MPHKTQIGKLQKSNQEQHMRDLLIPYEYMNIYRLTSGNHHISSYYHISKYHFKHYFNLKIWVVIAQNRLKNNIYFSQGVGWQPNRSTSTWSLHLQRRVDSPVSNKLKSLDCIDYPYIRLIYQTSAKFLQAQFMVSNRRSLGALKAS